MNAPMREDAAVVVRGRVREHEPMARHSSWRCGGPARRYFEPADREDLFAFVASVEPSEPLIWLGLGSNMLVRDGGLDATVIATPGTLSRLSWEGEDIVYAEAGVTCARLAREAALRDRCGLDFLAGIPGTVGGALCMNAGALGSETWSFVQRVETLDRSGRVRQREATEYTSRYRGISGPEQWFLGAWFHLPQSRTGGSQRIREVLAKRNQTQPTGQSSCGSVFKNPHNDFAGRLIEQCGLKGRRVGGAAVSNVHANFIVNDGSASATDIEALIKLVRDEVYAQCAVQLETEVEIVGVTSRERETGVNS